MLTVAIGDVHGCLAQLDALLAEVEMRVGDGAHRVLLLGDLIDRGPDSAGVIARVRKLEASAAGPEGVVCLMGNHEDMMLQALADPAVDAHWVRRSGGDATLRSFGVGRLAEVPADAVAWIRARPTVFEDGRRIFVHAGLDPRRPWQDQTDHDRMWIREPFLSSDHEFGRLVVHGHTPQRSGRPDTRRNRINLDTAAVYGGALTAAIFTDDQDDPVEMVQVR